MIRKTEYKHISGSDGLELSVLMTEPGEAGEVKGIVQLVHGMSEHKERYEAFMEFLTRKGYVCVIHDIRGHGGSVREPADLGYFYEGGYEAVIEDIHELTVRTKEYVNARCGDKKLPFILVGHSMGSLAVRCYIRKYDNEIDKLIILGCPSKRSGMLAGLALVDVLTFFKGDRAYSKLVDYIVIGADYMKRFKHERLAFAWVNSDRDEVERYNADPYCGFSFTLNGYRNLIRLTMLTYKKGGYALNAPGLPIRFFSGSDDPCAVSRADLAKAMRLLKKAGYKNVRGRMYPGMRHEILNEPGKAVVYRDILRFIQGKDET